MSFLEGLDADELGRLRSAQVMRDGIVRLPRLDLEQTPPVYNAMSGELNMRDLFLDGNYQGIGTPMDPENWLAVSRIGHRAVLIVDEVGVEAAAVTFVGVDETDSEGPSLDLFDFTANRPFLFLLLHEESDAPLMVAWVSDLSE